MLPNLQSIFGDPIEQIVSALNRGDACAVVANYSANSKLVSDNQNIYKGTEQILKAMERRLKEDNGLQYRVVEADVLTIASDVTVVELVVEKTPGYSLNRWICVVKLVDGEWKIAAQWVISNSVEAK